MDTSEQVEVKLFMNENKDLFIHKGDQVFYFGIQSWGDPVGFVIHTQEEMDVVREQMQKQRAEQIKRDDVPVKKNKLFGIFGRAKT